MLLLFFSEQAGRSSYSDGIYSQVQGWDIFHHKCCEMGDQQQGFDGLGQLREDQRLLTSFRRSHHVTTKGRLANGTESCTAQRDSDARCGEPPVGRVSGGLIPNCFNDAPSHSRWPRRSNMEHREKTKHGHHSHPLISQLVLLG